MHIACCLHVAEYIILQIGNGPQWIRHLLVLLDFPNHFGRFGPLGKVDAIDRLLDDGRNAVFDERQVS